MRDPRHSAARIFAWPLGIALATAAGLAAGLAGEGAWDRAAWLGLAVPAAVGMQAVRGRHRRVVPGSARPTGRPPGPSGPSSRPDAP